MCLVCASRCLLKEIFFLQAGIDGVVRLMNHYYLTRDDWDSIVELSLTQRDPINKIASNVKSAFTRT